MKSFLSVFLFVLFPISIAYLFWKLPSRANIPFPLRHGEVPAVTARRLQIRGIIHSEQRFIWLARITGLHRDIKTGFYQLSLNMPEIKVLYQLTIEGAPIKTINVRIREGSRIEDIARALNTVGIEAAQFDSLANDSVFIKKVSICCPSIGTPPSLEGYLYPDTYKFSYGIRPFDAACIMVKRLCRLIDTNMVKRMQKMELTLHETLTLASIIEKEAQSDRDRYIISGVFHNRLRLHMPLQSNPTLNYISGHTRGWLTSDEILFDSPYNTYRFAGLPPGPICSPSIKSIKAALWPAKVKYLYFVATGHGDHLYARTYRQQLRNERLVRSFWMEFRKKRVLKEDTTGKNVR